MDEGHGHVGLVSWGTVCASVIRAIRELKTGSVYTVPAGPKPGAPGPLCGSGGLAYAFRSVRAAYE